MAYLLKYCPYILINILVLFNIINISSIYSKINLYLITVIIVIIFQTKVLITRKIGILLALLLFTGNILLSYILIKRFINIDFISTYIALIWLLFIFMISNIRLRVAYNKKYLIQYLLFSLLIIISISDNARIIIDFFITNLGIDYDKSIKNINLLIVSLLLIFCINNFLLITNKLVIRRKLLNNYDNINILTLIILCVLSVIFLEINTEFSNKLSYALYILIIYVMIRNFRKLKNNVT